MRYNKRGQFYLIAAVVIIAIIIGFVTVSNYSKQEVEYTTVYGLEEGLQLESAKVLDYGVYKGFDEVNITNLLKGFTEAYADYAELDKLYFIFGNSTNITVAGYHDVEEGNITVSLEGENSVIYNKSVITISKSEYKTEEYGAPEGTPITRVVINVNGIDYVFDLKPGENFYFILVVNVKGEQYVVTNQDDSA